MSTGASRSSCRPRDQAFDLLVRLNGLRWTRTGDVIHVEPWRRGPSR